MGLDIFFYKYRRSEVMTKAEAKGYKKYEDYDGFEDLSTIGEDAYVANLNEVGYFRKVNFLVERLYGDAEDCENVPITASDLYALADDCKAILDKYEPLKEYIEKGEEVPTELATAHEELQDLCDSLLPTCEGFFFGNTEYDKWYFHDVAEVESWAREVADNTIEDDEQLIIHCWW